MYLNEGKETSICSLRESQTDYNSGSSKVDGCSCWFQRRQWQPTPVLLPGVYAVAKSQARLSDFTFTFHFHALEKEMAAPSSVLAWRVPGMGEPGGLPSMGPHRV